MKLILVRHGQTDFNLENRYLGALDPPLNDTGIAQAQALRSSLPCLPDVLVCSPLLRARQTAAILCGDTPRQPVIEPAFHERNVGVYEGLTQQEARERFPGLWARNVTRCWRDAPDGGESISAVAHRVEAGLCRLLRQYPDGMVLLVAHGFVAKVVRALAGAGLQGFHEWSLGNADSLTLEIAAGQGGLLSASALDTAAGEAAAGHGA